LSLLILFPVHAAPLGGKIPQRVEDKFLPGVKGIKVEVWVDRLEIPWSLRFLPDGRALVSERPGRIRLIKNGKLQNKPYAELDVAHQGEGGLMGLAVHPDFRNSPYVFAMHTYSEGGALYNRVVRIRDQGEDGALDRVILDRIPGASVHDGGRIAFGPDGLLYVTTGDASKADLAQDLGSLAGKILRITEEGGIPEGNPFKNSSVFCYGNRNPQGLAWHPESNDLFASEHGPSGEFLRFGHDEINRIVKGGNYGWPEVIGSAGKKEFIDPLIVWKEATPPAGMVFYDGKLLSRLKGSLFVATLRSRALIRIRMSRRGRDYRIAEIERWFASGPQEGKYGRLRDVVVGPEDALYFLTNNRDGRGDPQPGDDKIYRILPRE
jgi:quinoprotein glucose dehydrogenase